VAAAMAGSREEAAVCGNLMARRRRQHPHPLPPPGGPHAGRPAPRRHLAMPAWRVGPLRGAWKAYESALARRPLAVQVATSTALW
jgi:hypothetical protein